MNKNSYITRDPEILGGTATIAGTRVTVERVSSLFKQGYGTAELQEEYPFLKKEEIEAAVRYTLNGSSKTP